MFNLTSWAAMIQTSQTRNIYRLISPFIHTKFWPRTCQVSMHQTHRAGSEMFSSDKRNYQLRFDSGNTFFMIRIPATVPSNPSHCFKVEYLIVQHKPPPHIMSEHISFIVDAPASKGRLNPRHQRSFAPPWTQDNWAQRRSICGDEMNHISPLLMTHPPTSTGPLCCSLWNQ